MPASRGSPFASYPHLIATSLTTEPVSTPTPTPLFIAADHRFGLNENIAEMTHQSLINFTFFDNRSNVIIHSDLDSSANTVHGFTLREEQWVAPVMALSCLNMIVIALFEIFVIFKACRTTPSRRHLFLGQMLLLGLFMSSLLGIAFVPRPTWVSCTVIRIGLGVCYGLIYATLLVKTVFLLSLHSGIYLPASYQALLLFFIMAVQVAINGQWLIHHRSHTMVDYVDAFGQTIYKCDHNMSSLLFSLVYDIFLIGMVVCLSFRAKNHRENHSEAMFIAITICGSVVVWGVWVAGTLTTSNHLRDAFLALGVVGNATLVFLIMFLPKGRQLAAMGREGYIGDDRDQLSSPSSPSIYTPSFLHIKASHLMPLSKTNANLYKQFGHQTNTTGYHTRDTTMNGNHVPPNHSVKSNNNERFYYMPPPGPPPPPLSANHRVWRTGCYPTSYGHHMAGLEDPYLCPYDPQRQLHPNPNIKFYRGPMY